MNLLTKLAILLFSLGQLFGAEFLEPNWRGGVSSESAHWDRFTSASAANLPDIQRDQPTLDARLTCSTPSAFVTSSGNIYSFNSRIFFQLDDSASYGIQTVLLQVKTLGGELENESVRIVAADSSGQPYVAFPVSSFVLGDEDLPSGDQTGGQLTVQVFQFDFSEVPIVGTYSILFNSASSSMSLDEVVLDTSSSQQATVTRSSLELPRLELEMTANSQVALRYPRESAAGFKLQAASDFEGIDPWSDVTVEPVSDGDDWIVILPATAGSQFFRLIRP